MSPTQKNPPAIDFSASASAASAIEGASSVCFGRRKSSVEVARLVSPTAAEVAVRWNDPSGKGALWTFVAVAFVILYGSGAFSSTRII